VIRVIDAAADVIETHEQPRVQTAGNANCNLDKPVAISYLKSCNRFEARFCTGIVLTSVAILTMNWFLIVSLRMTLYPKVGDGFVVAAWLAIRLRRQSGVKIQQSAGMCALLDSGKVSSQNLYRKQFIL